MFKKLGCIICALVAGLILTASASWAATDLTGAGATFPYPIYSKWFDSYGKKTGTRINYQSIGSEAGIQQLKAKTVDFGASDAPLSDAKIKSMPRQESCASSSIGRCRMDRRWRNRFFMPRSLRAWFI